MDRHGLIRQIGARAACFAAAVGAARRGTAVPPIAATARRTTAAATSASASLCPFSQLVRPLRLSCEQKRSNAAQRRGVAEPGIAKAFV